jgi:hypothetical protein
LRGEGDPGEGDLAGRLRVDRAVENREGENRVERQADPEQDAEDDVQPVMAVDRDDGGDQAKDDGDRGDAPAE